ncbi:DUF2062 domain-containing protein [Pontibacter indicus]|uniref:Uncharacterized conserved protein, DUF2062 family n=1 Tax=Pontibacter indicus TaxID=1317125 RepID=A0A1R3WPX5_9BACT|nr:DUF2062 domain-containing protein [Pontibacter indicus]SIT79536.1 Uncharacterized conserved protein, DUF2062 family [Pontibacter indicus]
MSTSIVSAFFKRRIAQPVLNLLRQGMTPHKLAVTVSLGTVVGILPFFGVTTVLGTALAARFRLNIAATVLISYLVHPLQLVLIIPFIKAGIFMFGLDDLKITLDELIAMFRLDWLDALNKLWMANLAAVSAWAILAIPVGGLLYLALLLVLKRFLPKPAAVKETIPVAPIPELTVPVIPEPTTQPQV